MKYSVIIFVRNTADEYSVSVSGTFENLNSAQINYHQTCAALHNASDVKSATVKIEDEFGHELPRYIEQIEHKEAAE